MTKAHQALTDSEVYAALLGDDELRVVINAGIVIEAALDDLFRHAMQDSDALADIGLSYVQKVSLAVALGFQPRIKKPLRTLATLRNRFAHQLDAKLSDQDVNNFYASFDQVDKDIIQRSWKRMASEDRTPSAKLRDATPIEQFVTLVVTLNAALRAAATQAAAVKSLLSQK
ncbi:hypothetical protein [Ensifer sp. ZNC0028]|uniref:hypothetical protein n=1 Tax=Ensifer sp. ZNC0028 TaxID=1339236 RepID=UPI0006910C8C|nr:hypothetical protein [Ensifer sp. ZNC0028]